MKKRTKITIETHQVQTIRRRKPGAQAWCPGCSASVPMFLPEEAAVFAKVSSRTIYRWVEAGELHFTETPEGALLICQDSLTTQSPLGHFL